MRVVRLTSRSKKRFWPSGAAVIVVAERDRCARIVRDVQRRGDAALFYWTKRFDRIALRRDNMWITRDELRIA